MLRRPQFFAAIFLLAAMPSAAQRLLPNSFAGWTATGTASTAAVTSVAPVSSWAPQDVLNEYGWVSTQPLTYARGRNTLDVTLFQMKDPSAAYGLYSYLRTPDMPPAGLAEYSAASPERMLALLGNLVLDIRGQNLRMHEADLRNLVKAVKPHAHEGPLPTIGQHLPAKDMIQRTDHYVLGPETLSQFFPLPSDDWLGFSEGVEAETAKYRVQGTELRLLIADFPTPQTAQKKLDELQQKFNVNGVNPAGGSSVPVLFARRSVTLLAIVAGATSDAEADPLLSQVHSGTEITWNEAPFEVTQPNIGTYIIGAFIGTGVMCGFALIASLAFGGVRLVVKRMLPGKIFDRDDDIQVLQLGLSSKPINAADFYRVGRSRSK